MSVSFILCICIDTYYTYTSHCSVFLADLDQKGFTQIGGTNHLNPQIHHNYHGIKCVTNKATILYIHSFNEQNKPSFCVLFIFGLYQHFFSCFVLLLLSSPNNWHYGFGSELFANAIFVM
uniref:Uncharacterized protein n=1 Tax=Oryza meridionalis TaxID=40149 RepID=A0A0E0E4E2_9ORYZ